MTTMSTFTWNDELESKFLKARKNAKIKYFSMVTSGTFN
jgi:hypothetical protein